MTGDRQRLKQVLLNLASNAIKFTEGGGVTIEIGTGTDGGVALRVVDTGIGIAESDLERIMEPFTQADSSFSRTHEATGLGLSLSRALIELHGGSLTLTSVFGKGTTATVWLPAKRVMGKVDAA